MSNAILKIRDLSITLPKNADRQFAVEDVNLEVHKGEILCVVGESGSGKSTIARLITGIHAPTSGNIFFDGLNLTNQLKSKENIIKKRQIQMIFQDPFSSLNARMKVEDIISEPININKLSQNNFQTKKIVKDLLELVELDGLSEITSDF